MKRRGSVLIFGGSVIGLLFTSHCVNANQSANPIVKKGMSASKLNKAECKEKGGRWAGDVQGRGRLTGCILPTADAGKSCVDSNDCESVCLSSTEGLESGGHCYRWSSYKGCGIIVNEKGKRRVICVD